VGGGRGVWRSGSRVPPAGVWAEVGGGEGEGGGESKVGSWGS